jgi:hypothetical protein
MHLNFILQFGNLIILLDKKKKKAGEVGATTGPGGVQYAPREQDNSIFRLIGSWKAEGEFKQTYPPTIPISKQFING